MAGAISLSALKNTSLTKVHKEAQLTRGTSWGGTGPLGLGDSNTAQGCGVTEKKKKIKKKKKKKKKKNK